MPWPYLSPFIYVIDLSNEVLDLDFSLGAAKIAEVKVVGKSIF